uniref:Putative evasin n=1 Tax=Rhipicephalus microplus TaxID=6941 RepID=A0A6G5A3N7_RHIMP
MNAVIVLAFTAFALIIHDCYSEAEKIAPDTPKDQCTNKTCHRRVDLSGRRVTDGCPDGCLCVFRQAENVYPADGTCYLLATTKSP